MSFNNLLSNNMFALFFYSDSQLPTNKSDVLAERNARLKRKIEQVEKVKAILKLGKRKVAKTDCSSLNGTDLKTLTAGDVDTAMPLIDAIVPLKQNDDKDSQGKFFGDFIF